MDQRERRKLLAHNVARRNEIMADLEARRYERWLVEDPTMPKESPIIRKTFQQQQPQQQQQSTDWEGWLNIRLSNALTKSNEVMCDEVIALVDARTDMLQNQINELRDMIITMKAQ